jgi:hypothetical protein
MDRTEENGSPRLCGTNLPGPSHPAGRGLSRGSLCVRDAAAKTGGPEGDQTPDLVVANDALYQLSYRPARKGR